MTTRQVLLLEHFILSRQATSLEHKQALTWLSEIISYYEQEIEKLKSNNP